MDVFESLLEPIIRAIPEITVTDLVLAPAPKPELGDVALRTFEAAKKLHVPPPQLAARIAGEIPFGPEVQSATAAGPYVNFRLDRGTFGRRIVNQILETGARFGSSGSGSGRKVLVEHTSINPNASPHVGRARNAMLGDSLVRMLRFEGHEVEVHYYVNDMGRQIGLLVLACDELENTTFDQILGIYVEANARAEQDPRFAEEGYALLAKMEQGDPETQRKFHAVTELCLRGQLNVLTRLGVSYDVFDRESRFVKDPRLDKVLEALREKGALFTDAEERLVVDMDKLGHPHEEGRFFVLMRANGSSMYGYRDLAYTIDKSERGADLDFIVLGEDHKLYANQIAMILDAAGYASPEAVFYAYILLKEGKMATRQGNVVLLSDFLDEAMARAGAKVSEQCKDLSETERAVIAEQVAVAAIRFAILRVSPNKNVIFDWESALSFTGDTGPYIQYSCARIASILRKFGPVPPLESEFPLDTDAEWNLLLHLNAFPEVVSGALAQRNSAPIAQFALDTARRFTTFYHECPVLEAPSHAHRNARARICSATRQALVNALGLLGIAAPERM